MRTRDIEILIVPGRHNADADHWLSRWQRNLPTARRIEQSDWSAPTPEAWTTRIGEEVARASRPAVLVAHGLGALAVALAAPRLEISRLAGAFLVAPCDPERLAVAVRGWQPDSGGFHHRLPFAAAVVASTSDPACGIERAAELADAWGAAFTNAGALGGIDTASGHGPWPDGLLRFGAFLRSLGSVQ